MTPAQATAITAWARLEAILTPEQHAAATAPPGPVAVLAVAGAGKTTLLVARTIWLLTQEARSRVLLCAFGRAAAAEIGARLKAELGGKHDLRVTVGTLHATALNIIRRAPESCGRTYRIDERGKYAQLAAKVVYADRARADAITPKRLLDFASRAKAEGISGDGRAIPGSFTPWVLATRVGGPGLAQLLIEGYDALERERAAARVLTFDDMPIEALRAIREDAATGRMWRDYYDHVLVDEAQDLNAVQDALARDLSGAGARLFMVGDVCQAIYGFRGARPDFLLRFAKTATVVRVSTSRRAGPVLCEAASKLVLHVPWNPLGAVDAAFADPPGIVVQQGFTTPEDEAEHVAETVAALRARGLSYGDCAVLYRLRVQSQVIGEVLTARGIPWRHLTKTEPFWNLREVQDVLAWLSVAACDDPGGASARRLRKAPPSGLGKKYAEQVEVVARAQRVAYFDALAATVPTWPKARAAHRRLTALVHDLNRKMHEGAAVRDLIETALRGSSYLTYLNKDGEGSPDEARAVTVHELLRVSDRFASVQELLQRARAKDSAREVRGDHVALSTIHGAKGLEFPVVFVVGVADGILPFSRAEDADEELRLFFVALTRAQRAAVVSYAQHVSLPSGLHVVQPSPFLAKAEVPNEATVLALARSGWLPTAARAAAKLGGRVQLLEARAGVRAGD